MWELKHIAYRIEGRALVEGVDLAIAPGKLVGALGPNGAGKSTLLRLAAGLLDPSEGEARLDGRPLREYTRREAARRIAFVPQDTHVEFPFTAFEIALMGRNPRLGRFQWPGPADREAVRRAMERTETIEFAERPATTLSGGERQRVFLARALASESEFIALDEPTANLDVQHVLQFLSLARDLTLREGRGILMAMHDLNVAQEYCDQVLLLDRGRVAGVGAPGEVLTPDRIRRVFRVDVEPLTRGDGGTVLAFRQTE
ncbi:MAG: ABC transporter ATP-binding protein [Candidatus Sumerlaeota bacterium]|nr:ABC transporter ATP-binding protein [Candidatus Sumerlaeota bacterium]